MRIAPARRTGVQSLGRHSVGNTGHEGDARLATTIGDVGQALAGETAALLDRRDQQKADILMQKSEADFYSQYGGREFIKGNELPEHLRGNRDLDEDIPSAQVMPALYKDHVDRNLKSASGKISLQSSRNNWMANKTQVAETRLNNLQIASNKAIESQVLKDQIFDADEALEMGNYEMSKEIINSMAAPTDFKDSAILNVKKKQEQGGYKNLLSEYQGDLTDLREASAYLGQEYDTYKAAGGNLSPVEKLAAKREVDQKIKTETSISEKLPKKIKAQLDRDIKLALSNGLEGKKSNVENLQALWDRTITANELSDEDYEKELIELRELGNFSEMSDQMLLMNRDQREAALSDKPEIAGYSPQQNRKLQNDLAAAHDAKTRAENTDLMSSAADAGIFGEQGLTPINFRAPPDVLYKQIASRKDQYEKARAQYGEGLGNGILASQEAKALSKEFENMSVIRQSEMLMSVGAALGLEAGSDFFQQLASDGESSTLSNAGVAAIHGYTSEAETMLQGMKYRKNNPDEMKDFNANVNDQLFTTIGNMFVNKPVKRGTMKNTITDAYVGIAIQRGESLEIFDEDIYQEAVRMATGGVFEQGDYKLANPVYGMEDGAMEDWLDDTNYMILENQRGGGVARRDMNTAMSVTESAKDTWERIQDGDYQLQGSDQTDEWIVTNNVGVPFLDSSGKVYRLKYDPAADKGRSGILGEAGTGEPMKGRYGGERQ
jgi:hypothetical protein